MVWFRVSAEERRVLGLVDVQNLIREAIWNGGAADGEVIGQCDSGIVADCEEFNPVWSVGGRCICYESVAGKIVWRGPNGREAKGLLY